MRATLLQDDGTITVDEVPVPDLSEPTDALVRVTHSAVCGSDLHLLHGFARRPGGRRMGHEAVGVVEAVGADVVSVAVGDVVIVPFSWSDGTCSFCREGTTTSCVRGGDFLMAPSALQAELARVPEADGTLVVVPADVEEEMMPSLLTLADVYLTGHHAVVAGGAGPGSTVVVIGDGAVGLSTVLAARHRGAERIVLLGRHADRTDLGVEFGATDVVPGRGDDAVDAVREITRGEGAHVVVDAVGELATYATALDTVRPGGVVSRVGVPRYDDAPLGLAPVFRRNVTVTGGVAPVRAYVDEVLPRVLDGTIRPGRVFDRELPLSEAAEAYRLMDSREALKVLLRP